MAGHDTHLCSEKLCFSFTNYIPIIPAKNRGNNAASPGTNHPTLGLGDQNLDVSQNLEPHKFPYGSKLFMFPIKMPSNSGKGALHLETPQLLHPSDLVAAWAQSIAIQRGSWSRCQAGMPKDAEGLEVPTITLWLCQNSY